MRACGRQARYGRLVKSYVVLEKVRRLLQQARIANPGGSRRRLSVWSAEKSTRSVSARSGKSRWRGVSLKPRWCGCSGNAVTLAVTLAKTLLQTLLQRRSCRDALVETLL